MQLQTGRMGQFHTLDMLSMQQLHYMLLVTPTAGNKANIKITRKLQQREHGVSNNLPDKPLALLNHH